MKERGGLSLDQSCLVHPPPPEPWEVQDFVLHPAWCRINLPPLKGEDGDKKIYVAGDPENIPEMKTLKDIDIAFLPMNLPFTMTPEMVSDAAKGQKKRGLSPPFYFFPPSG